MEKKLKVRRSIILLIISLSLIIGGCGSKKEEADLQELKDGNTLVKTESMDIKYAKNFKVDYFEGGYKILTDASNRETLIVPEGKDLPTDLDKDINIIQQPVEDVGIYSTIEASWFRPIDEINKIATVTYDRDSWRMDEVIQRLDSGQTVFIGKTDAVDYELLQSISPTVHLASKTYEDSLYHKFDELGFTYLSMGAHLEEDPRGRLEWLKFVSTLFDKEDSAIEYYDDQLARIDKVVKATENMDIEKPNVAIVYFSSSKKLFNVTKPTGHQAKMTELAGGIPYPQLPDSEGRGGVSMSNEEFYKEMQDVDMIIYDNITGHLIQNKSDLLSQAEFIGDLKVVEEGNIIGLQRQYWQSADKVAELIENLHEFITKPVGQVKENEFYFLMD